MKHFLLIPLFVLIGVADALPVYNPAAASLLPQGVLCEAPVEYCCWYDALSLNFGFTGYSVREHKMKQTSFQTGNNSEFSKRTNAGYIAVNVCNRIDFFSTLGATNIYQGLSQDIVDDPGPELNEKVYVGTDTAFSWSFGARATILQLGCLALGVEGEYFNTKPSVNQIETNGQVLYFDGNFYDYQEWQVGFGGAYRINISSNSTALIPYIAARVGGTRVTSTLFALPSLKQLRSWGYAVGLTLVGCDKIQVTAESSFLNEKGILFNSTLRF